MPDPSRWDATAYRDVAAVQRDWGRALLAGRDWRGDERVLDAGCGTGELAEELLATSRAREVVALDRDAGMVAATRALLARFGARAQVVQGDVAALPGIAPVDVVFSNAVLHWVPDHDAAFRGFARVLAPGGALLAQCGGKGNLGRARTVAAELFARAPYAQHQGALDEVWYYADVPETRRRLAAAGFVETDVSLVPVTVVFPTDEAWQAFLAAVVLRLHLAALPRALHGDFLAHYRERAVAAGLERRLDYVRLTMTAVAPGP